MTGQEDDGCPVCEALGQEIDGDGNIWQVRPSRPDGEVLAAFARSMGRGVEGEDWDYFQPDGRDGEAADAGPEAGPDRL